MKPLLEPPRLGFDEASLVVSERKQESFDWNWHYHPEIELTWIGKGRGTRLVGDHSDTYGPGDLVLVGANLPHTWFSSKGRGALSSRDNEAIVVQFRPETVPAALLALPEFARVAQLLARAAHGVSFSPAAGRNLEKSMRGLLRQTGVRRWLRLIAVLSELASCPMATLASAGYHHRRSFKLSAQLERVTGHIDRHPGEEITLGQAARMAGLTPGAFSRFFRKMTHKTFVDYRNGCRIREACRLLTETDLRITEIAHACGFGNLANFNRRFRKEKQMAPRDYRRLHEAPAPMFA